MSHRNQTEREGGEEREGEEAKYMYVIHLHTPLLGKEHFSATQVSSIQDCSAYLLYLELTQLLYVPLVMSHAR